MAPCPEEVDVYFVPHLRMKELVSSCTEKCHSTNFSGHFDLESLLSTLIKTFIEFKNHEMIENTYIMKKLKRKLKKLSIRNSAVCNCHKDSHLIDMLKILKEGYSKETEQDRINYGIQLRRAMEEFAEDFLPHMREEEETFLPLLQKYFTYEELKEMRCKVIDKHFEEQRAHAHRVEDILQAEELEKWALEQQVKETSSSSACESDWDCTTTAEISQAPRPPGIETLPPEVLLKVLSHLNPQDLCRTARVSKMWNEAAMDPSLWRHLHPVKWAKGEWDYVGGYDSDLVEEDNDDYSGRYRDNETQHYVVIDDDADVDEAEMPDDEADATDAEFGSVVRQLQREGRVLLGLKNHVMSRVGDSVRVLNLSDSQALTSGVLQKMLKQCPNLETLDLSHTKISDSALKGIGKNSSCSYLKQLILTGCDNITDTTLMRVAMAVNKPLMEQDGLSDSSSDEVGGAGAKLHKCVCVKYENMKQKMKNCQHSQLCNKMNQLKIEKENEVDLDKDIDETQETEESRANKDFGGRKADYARTFDAYSAPEEKERETRDKNNPGAGINWDQNHGNQIDRTVYGFHGDPREFCATYCAAGKPRPAADTLDADNIEECVTTGVHCARQRGSKASSELEKRPDFEFFGDGVWESEGDIDKDVDEESCREPPEVCLEYLSLSGCYRITDIGIRSLCGYGPLPRLRHLDLSGCVNVTGEALTQLVDRCPALQEERLFYCDNIVDGPFCDTASGCNNVECSRRFCCRT